MNFGEQFKKIRTEKKLTQEQVAAQLHISRQAVSNWENNKNLPDLEMLVSIAKTFDLSLDQLILDDPSESNLTAKLIKDGSENRRVKLNLISLCVGAILLVMGAGCFFMKANSVEYVEASGLLHENFFMLPIGFLLIFCGILSFLIAGFRNILWKCREKRESRQ